MREMRTLLRTSGTGARFACMLLLRCPFDAANTLILAAFLSGAFNAVSSGDGGALNRACALYLFASLCLFAYNGTVWRVYAAFVVRMEAGLREALFRKIAALPCERVDALPRGEWITRLNTDVQMPFSQPSHLPHAACAAVNIAVSAVILWRVNPAVFGWVMLFVIPHIAFGQLAVARAMPELQRKSLEAAAANTGELTALITCAGPAALYNAGGYLLGRFEQSSLALLRANMRVRARNALGAAVLPLFGLGGYLTLLVVCAKWIGAGAMTFGNLTAAFQYRGGVLVGCLTLINCLISIQASAAGIRRLNQTLAEKEDDTHE